MKQIDKQTPHIFTLFKKGKENASQQWKVSCNAWYTQVANTKQQDHKNHTYVVIF
jgi:hypothetical protein